MTGDARYEDADETPLRLIARDAEDLAVISALLQDAVFLRSDITRSRRLRQAAILLTRFRWEDAPAARAQGRRFERVRTLLVIEDIRSMAARGLEETAPDTVLSALTLEFRPGEDGSGRLVLHLSGDGALGFDVECLSLHLTDVTRPHEAPSRRMPAHPLDDAEPPVPPAGPQQD
ncbi:MAG: DUF2948 family protein [Rhodobacteraceae bacterium]|nr:DUF2948 family protein [Paracoccaceae bacterium]